MQFWSTNVKNNILEIYKKVRSLSNKEWDKYIETRSYIKSMQK